MKSFDEIKKLLAEHKETLENKYKVKSMGVFGSFVRGKQKKKSDIDILVDIKEDISLLDYIGIKLELERALKRKVDLVEYSTIKPLIRERILQEQVRIL